MFSRLTLSCLSSRHKLIRERGYFRYGFATPMRGKSLTCRTAFRKTDRSTTAKLGSETDKKECVCGKSETCRASVWQSHDASGLTLVLVIERQVVTCRFDRQLQLPARSVTGKLKKRCSPRLQLASCSLISTQEVYRNMIHPARAGVRLRVRFRPC